MAEVRTRKRSQVRGWRAWWPPFRRTGDRAKRDRANRDRKPRSWVRRLGSVAALVGALPMLAVFLITTWVAVLPPFSTLMARDLVTFQGYTRDHIALDAAEPVLLHSIIASEDQTFCFHDGVEWDALWTQFERWRAGDDARGASTLTMQIARNLFLWQGRSPVRKAFEVPLAAWLDFALSKRRLMEIYINMVELGPRLYGFEAAAQQAFDRSASTLSRRQAALLVATLPLPAERDAAQPTRRQTALADIIQRRAHQMGAYVGCLAAPAPPA